MANDINGNEFKTEDVFSIEKDDALINAHGCSYYDPTQKGIIKKILGDDEVETSLQTCLGMRKFTLRSTSLKKL